MKAFLRDSTSAKDRSNNDPTIKASQRDALSSSIDHVTKSGQAQNNDFRSWLKLPFRRLLFSRIANKTERRKIVAFGVAFTFLLITFWNSLEQDQLKKDLEKSKLEERLFSGMVSENSEGHSNFRNVVVIYSEIDANGKPVIPDGMPADVVRQLKSMRFDPPKRDGIPVRVKIPILLSIE
jgi:hypothetical protein